MRDKRKIVVVLFLRFAQKQYNNKEFFLYFELLNVGCLFLKIDYTEKIEENQIQYFEIWGGFIVVHLLSECSQNSELLNQIEGAL